MATASTSAKSTANAEVLPKIPPEIRPSSHFTCNACSANFENMQSQRAHMKEPWHVYNIKRRMVSLPPISAHIFDTQIQAQAPSVTPTIIPVLGEESDSSHTSDSDLSIESYPEELTSSPVGSSLCIFCDLDFQTSEDSISHMQHMHGLHIPNSTYSTDLETFIEYLRTLVLQYHECLYCGHVKRSAQGIRQHMMSKGHCMIDLSPGSNLLEFWDFPEGEAMGSRSEVDAVERSAASLLKVPRLHGSGEVRRRQRISTRRPRKAVAADGSNDASQERQTHPRASRDRQVAARGESGMLGVSDQQKRALRAVEKTFLKQEVVARAHQRWAVEKVANRQKNFKSDVPGRKNG